MNVMCPRRIFLGIFISLFLTARFCFGQTLTLPLHGYFHPGRAMPAAADFSESGGGVELTGEEAITTRFAGQPGAHVVVPFLALDATVRDSQLELHALDDSDCLVGDGGDDPAAAGKLFPAKRLITVRLDPVHPIQGPAMAWETLDGLLVTPIGLANISDEMLRELNVAGVTIAVSGESEPRSVLAWRREGGLWIARGVPSITASATPDAYAPTLQWLGGKSLDFRRQIVLLGTLFGILAGGVCLTRSRWSAIAAAGLVTTFGLAADWNNRGFSPVASAMGIVQFDVDRKLAVADVWVFEQSHRDADFDLAVSGSVHPIAMENSQWRNWNLVLTCGSDGTPVSLSGRLKANEPLAVVMRRVAAAGILSGGPVDSPMRLLAAPSLYGEYEIAGQNGPRQSDAETQHTRWGMIVLKPIN